MRKKMVKKDKSKKVRLSKKSKINLKKIKEHFKVYSHGVKRLAELEEELNSLDTRKFPLQAEKIRQKLKNVTLIPEIEQDLKSLKLLIAGFDINSTKATVDIKQDKKIRGLKLEENELEVKILGLRRKIKELNNEIERVEKIARRKQVTRKELVEIDNLPLLKLRLNSLIADEQQLNESVQKFSGIGKKVGFLRRLFRKDSDEIERIESKVDGNTLEFYNRLTKELAESRRMIEEEKFELKKQLLEVLADSIRQINLEKEESDKKILAEIEKVRIKLVNDKKEVSENMISKIVQLKSRLEDSKKELQEETELQIGLLKKKLDEPKAVPIKIESVSISDAKKTLPIFKKSALDKKEELSSQKADISIPISSSFFPQMPKLPDIPQRQKVLTSLQIAPRDLKRAVIAAESEIVKKQKLKIIKPKAIRIPAKRFMEYSQFTGILSSMNEIEKIVSLQKKQISHQLESDLGKKELDKCLHEAEQVLGIIKNASGGLFINP